MSVAPYGQPAYASGCLFGRDEELAAIETFLAAAATGPQRVVLEGEAGIGKTVLWDAAIRGARERGHTVLACRPPQPRMGHAFSALAVLLEPVLSARRETLPPPQRRALETALGLREPSGPPPLPGAIAGAVLGMLQDAGTSQPVVLAIDDAERLDRDSAFALSLALGRVKGGADLRSVGPRFGGIAARARGVRSCSDRASEPRRAA